MNGKAGDGAEVLTAPQRGRVRAILMLGGVSFHNPDDGLQQVQLRLVESASAGSQPVRNVDAWIGVVASRVAVDWHRAALRDAGLRQRLEQVRGVEGGNERHRLVAMAVAEELEALTMAERQILTLRFYADLTIEQMAQVLEIPEGTVKSRLHYASASLRRRLQDGDLRDD